MDERSEIRFGWRRRSAALIAALMLLGSTGVAHGAEDETVLVRAAAMGAGSHFIFSRPGSAPVEPPIDARFGAAGGSLDQLAGNAFGFASSFYPGDTPATPGSLIPLLGFPIGGQIFPADHPVRKEYDGLAGLIPPWPMATHGSYPGDPGRRVDLLADVTGNIPAPLPVEFQGMTQETTVDEFLVVAETNIDRLTVSGLSGLNPEFEPLTAQLEQMTKNFAGDRPGVRGSSFTIQGLNSRYRMVNEGAKATSTSEVVVREVDVFGGLFEFFRVRSHATHEATAEGVELVSYGTEVGLARILGLEVTFDDKGAVLADRRVPPDQRDAVQAAINQFLSRSPFGIAATGAAVEGTHVTGSAFTFTFDAQEPTLPGISPIGRHTRVTWLVGAIDADMEAFSSPATLGDGGGTADVLDGGEADVPVSLPGRAPVNGTGPAAERPAPTKAAIAASPTAASRAAARTALLFSPTLPALDPAVSDGTEGPAAPDGGDVQTQAPALTALPAAALARVPTLRPAGPEGEAQRLTLLPGVVASDAEQRQIAAALEDTGKRMALLAGVGSLGGLVMWRRRRGRLQ